jgi:hypothetical protein
MKIGTTEERLVGRRGSGTNFPLLTTNVGTSFSDDDNLHVVGAADDSMDQVPSNKPLPGGILRPDHEELGDVVKAGKVQQGCDDVLALQNAGFNVEVAGEVEVAFHGLAL